MPSSGGKAGGKGGSSGQASNAALQDDEDTMARRRITFHKWKGKRKSEIHPNHMIDYENSPKPPRK